MMEKPRLKPCPFCGEQAELDGDGTICPDTPYYLFYQVRCDCGVCGPRFYQHQHLAVQGWNKMARKEP